MFARRRRQLCSHVTTKDRMPSRVVVGTGSVPTQRATPRRNFDNHTCAEFALNISIDTRLRAQRLLPPFRLIAGPMRVARPSALEGGTRPYEAAARHARQGASHRRGDASSCRARAMALGSVAASRALESRAFDTELVHAAVAPPYAHERRRGGRRLVGAVQCSAQGGALLERAVVKQPHRL